MIVQQIQQHIHLQTMLINIQILVVVLNKFDLPNVKMQQLIKLLIKWKLRVGNDSYSKEVIVDYGNKKAQPLISSTNYINNEDLSRKYDCICKST